LALAWILHRPEITSVALGISGQQQLLDNAGALELVPPVEALAELDRASCEPMIHPYTLFEPGVQALVHGEQSASS
jgi:aryl-alcohol dehydrogenase-like predicted oxidoreductase